MPNSLDDNAGARAAILGRVRDALGHNGDEKPASTRATAYLAARAQGPRPALPTDIVAHFAHRATELASTVERIVSRKQIPGAVARYLDALDLAPAIAEQKSYSGVCWPEFEDLDWASAGLTIEPRPTAGNDLLGVTSCFCAIAETGTLVFVTGPDTPTATALLPATHIAVVPVDRVVPGMEDAFERVRRAHPGLPRAINMISGPSRTGDIEQTIVLGAHGPFRVHILLIDEK